VGQRRRVIREEDGKENEEGGKRKEEAERYAGVGFN